jgi:pimeloyl-ACP methyl ester carboxylesterase
MDTKLRQRIRYLRTEDGVQLAWAEIGTGPVLIKAANWLSHLEYELESPVWGHWIRFFGDHFRFLRWDERGCGLTDRDVGELSFDRWLEDLEAVVAASGVEEPFALLGISSGAAVCLAYAARHPERVSRLVLYGGYARGWARRGHSETERQYRAMIELMRVGWGKENPVFRQIFTSRFIPGASEAQIGWYNELLRRTSTGDSAARLLEARSSVDVSGLLGEVKAPTIIVHSRDDESVPSRKAPPARRGRGPSSSSWTPAAASFSRTAAWVRFQKSSSMSTGHAEKTPPSPASSREREVLVDQPELGNADIGEPRDQREDRAESHLESVDKLGFGPGAGDRLARDRGFRSLDFRSCCVGQRPGTASRGASAGPRVVSSLRSGRIWDAPARDENVQR